MRKISLVLGLLGVAATTQVFAGPTQSNESFLHNIFNSTNRPEWLTHTYLSYAFQRYNKPITELETTQPFYMDCWNTVFAQARVASSSGSAAENLGLGYRVLTDSNQMMWGINAFGDYGSQYNSGRASLGGEMFTPYIVLRADIYRKLTDTKTISTSPGVANYDRALNGYDLSIETPFPFVSWIRFVAQGFRYVGNKTSGANGGVATLRIYPARQVEIDAGFSADNRNGRTSFLKLDYYFGSPDFIENTMTTPNYYGAYAPVTVEKQRLQKIIRHNDIVTEKSNSAGESAGVVDVRGT